MGGISSRAREFDAGVVAMLPMLRRYAIRLSRSSTVADDLVNETAVKALTSHHLFRPGTNLEAWLTTIMYRSWLDVVYRRARERGQEDATAKLAIEDSQYFHVLARDLAAGIAALPRHYREALCEVALNDRTLQDVADESDLPVGTIKSRVSRARSMLRQAGL